MILHILLKKIILKLLQTFCLQRVLEDLVQVKNNKKLSKLE